MVKITWRVDHEDGGYWYEKVQQLFFCNLVSPSDLNPYWKDWSEDCLKVDLQPREEAEFLWEKLV